MTLLDERETARVVHDDNVHDDNARSRVPPRVRRLGSQLLAVVVGLAVLLVVTRIVGGGREPAAPGSSRLPTAGVGDPLGVRTGFARTQFGAADAAAAYLAVYNSPGMFEPARRRALVDRITDPDRVAAVREQLDAAMGYVGQRLALDPVTGLPSIRGTLIARSLPLGYQVVSFTQDRAVVAVWQNALLGVAGSGSRQPVQESWSTETVTLRWAGGDWRWQSVSSTPGPAPVASTVPPAPAARLAGQFLGFTGYAHVAP